LGRLTTAVNVLPQTISAEWLYRVALFLGLPLAIGAVFGVLFWGDMDEDAEAVEFIALGVLLVGLITIGFFDLKVIEWVGQRDWFALAVLAAHFLLTGVFVLGAFAPFVISIGGLALTDVEEIAFECCWTNADKDFAGVFREYFGLTAVLALFCAPVSAAIWWASRALPFGRRA
jgi:hypothetical protein